MSIELGSVEKESIQKVIESIHEDDLEKLLAEYASSGSGPLKRLVQGAVNHPITWRVGIIQLQMQTGLWGRKWQSVASVRANAHGQVVLNSGNHLPLIKKVVMFNLRYRKADIAGRLVGGQFTNYASTVGKLGNRLSKTAKKSRNATNFAIAGYGCAIQAIAQGYSDLESITHSVLTGRVSRIPPKYLSRLVDAANDEELTTAQGLGKVISDLKLLSEISPGPVSVKEFCLQPENADLRGLCK